MSFKVGKRPRAAAYRRARLASAALAATLFVGGRASAAPEEIEVYRGELGARGAFALETNHSYVLTGNAPASYPGEQASIHRYRLTPELSYGLTSSLELGVLAVTTADRTGRLGFDGLKARVRYIAPHQETGWYWGANLEVGRVDRRQALDPWGAELRGIAGYEGRRWILAVNPTLETSLGGPAPEPVSLQIQSKIGYRLSGPLILGLESYNSLGPVRDLGRLRQEEQMLYLTADLDLDRLEVNLGVGRGLTSASDGWVLKAVIGVEFDGPP